MLKTNDYKLVLFLTFLVFLLFGGGSVAMTYLARRRNTPPPTVLPIPTILTPTPTPSPKFKPVPTHLPAKKVSYVS